MTAPEFVDLFAGVGGLDVAARSLGVATVGVEFDADACQTRRAAGLPTVEADVRKHGPADFPDATGLMGGPPCQTFSGAGEGSGRQQLEDVLAAVKAMAARQPVTAVFADDRTGLVLEPLRWALTALDAGRPYRVIVLEQVPQVLPVWAAYAEALTAEGYSATAGILRAEQFGVPQTRKRAFLIARLDGTATLPAPTHRPYRPDTTQDAGDPGLLPWVSMGDALDREQPFTVISNYGTGGDPRNRGRRGSDQPAATVTGKISRFRIVGADGTEQPRFTDAEAGRLQTFPADYPWSGRNRAQQAGNAVPPRLARAVLATALAAA
jgi:DNA (cytosine-5)-methyltransferase 1